MCDPNEVVAALRESDELRLKIVRDIGNFTVALFAVFDSKKGDDLRLAGTGTLITVGGSYYILTAAHVWEDALKLAVKVGITLLEDISHRFLMDVKTIVRCGPPKPAIWGEWGPDITFLRVPSEYLGSISAHRAFYGPTVDGQTIPNVDYVEIRVLMGTPEAFGTFTQIHADVEISGRFVVDDIKLHMQGGYDYLDLGIDTSSPSVPESFGGVSGGGLWKVLVYCSRSTGKIDWVRSLEGVAFWEFPVENNRRVIRCHGPKSILMTMPSS